MLYLNIHLEQGMLLVFAASQRIYTLSEGVMDRIVYLATRLMLPALSASLHSTTGCQPCTGIHNDVGRSEFDHQSPRKIDA
jgi:hypothetical protein